jgi:hypothetical protein
MLNHLDFGVDRQWINTASPRPKRAPPSALVAFCAAAALSCGVQAHGGQEGASGGVTVVVVTTPSSGAEGSGAASGDNSTASGATSGGSSGEASGASSGGAESGTASTGAATSGLAESGTASTGAASSGALSGISIVINGTAVPKEHVIAYVHLGHSNMAGRADSASMTPCPGSTTCSTVPFASRPYFFMDPDPHGWMFHTNNGFQPADEPLTAGDSGNDVVDIPGQTLPLGGPGTALIKESIALAPDYYFVSLGHGVGSAYCSQFLPGSLYYNDVMAAPLALKGKVTFGAIVIMLGITERHGTQADITGYASCINKLVTAIRTDLSEPNLPLLLTDYEMGATNGVDGCLAPSCPFAQQIIAQIQMVPGLVSNSAIVPTDGLVMLPPPDDHHFNLEGHAVWVQRALAIMQKNGWFPWQ